MNKQKDKLQKMIDVNLPIIYIQDYDFVRTDALIDSVKLNERTKIKEWNPATGNTNFSLGNAVPQKFFRKTETGGGSEETLEKFLKREMEYEPSSGKDEERFIVLRNVHEELNDKKIVTCLQLIAQRRLEEVAFSTTIFIVSSVLNIPEELTEFVSVFETDFPDANEIKEIIREHAVVNRCDVKDEDIDELMPSLKGLTRFQVDRMIDMAISENGTFGSKDKSLILQQKHTIVKKSGIMELVKAPAKLDDIGGLENLKTYLRNKKEIITRLEDAASYGVAVPKGIFLVGMPGCGKSLCAKAAATLFNTPLLKLDMGRLQAKYVGESEGNLRKAIRTAEAAAPCVLWIDEIEKGFATGDGKNDVVMRMFATFLSWLQEKTSSVYVIATANNAENLPPELKRKGRFDEIFCVDLPDDKERSEIFKVHLRRFNNSKGRSKCENINHSELSRETNGFNGADIEAVVNAVAEKAYLKEGDEKGRITPQDFMETIKNTKSISMTCKKQIDDMKKIFEECKFTSASKK